MRKTITAAIVAAAMLTASTALAKPIKKACDASAKAAKKACVHGASDAFFIAIGTCDNVSDADARKQCVDDAKSTLAEAKGDCADQSAARLDACTKLGQAPYEPAIDPNTFLSAAQIAANPNPYFPLVPGTVWVYQGGGEKDTVTVTNQTKEILGVTTIIVSDVVRDSNDVVLEDTDDFFAQQTDGTVWYFGELSQSFENGELASLAGTWRAGVDGAKPGIIMKAMPMVGDVYRQEFSLGVAEDIAEVTSTTGTESVPAASCSGTCVVTHEFSPLDPGGDESKFYAPGVGLMLEIEQDTGDRNELVSKTP